MSKHIEFDSIGNYQKDGKLKKQTGLFVIDGAGGDDGLISLIPSFITEEARKVDPTTEEDACPLWISIDKRQIKQVAEAMLEFAKDN